MPSVKINHGYYRPYFYWMFPLVVANEQGLFQEEGIDFSIHDIVEGGQPEDKAYWYKEALDENSRDFYFCCAWQGVYSTCSNKTGKIGAGLKSTLIKTFAIYSKPHSTFENILDIVREGAPIAVNKNADAHYVTLKNMSEFVPAHQIKFAHLGGIERCFKALINNEVKVATLAGPYAEAAEALGYRRLLSLSRTEPTFIVLNDRLDEPSSRSFLVALNKAIDLINGDRARYRERYLQEFRAVVEKYLPEISGSLATILPQVRLPAWDRVDAVSRNEFDEIQTFLLDNGMSVNGPGYEKIVEPEIALGIDR